MPEECDKSLAAVARLETVLESPVRVWNLMLILMNIDWFGRPH